MNRVKAGAVLVVIALIAAGGVFYVLRGNDDGDPEGAAEAYLAAWADNDLDGMQELVVEVPSDFEEVHEGLVESLGVGRSASRTPDRCRRRRSPGAPPWRWPTSPC